MARMIRRALSLLFLAAAVGAAQTAKPSPWVMQNSGTTASLRGIHALPGGIAWASGTDGTVLRTEDGGYLWQKCAVPHDAEKQDFRSIWAWDAQRALAVSSGPAYNSRIYKTSDGCKTWKRTLYNPDPNGFWDGIVFITEHNAFLLGDPLDGRWDMKFTQDAGDTWFGAGDPGLEADAKTEGAFAASNSSLAAMGPNFWFGSGGTGGAFLHYSTKECAGQPKGAECPLAWHKVAVPMAGGTAGAGVFSVSAREYLPTDFHPKGQTELKLHVVAVGGDYEKPNESKGTAAYSTDGGVTWTAAAVPPHGYRSAVAWDKADRAWIAVGTNGSDYSRDDGKTWQPLDDGEWNALSLPYVVGPKGRIAKLADNAIPRK